MYPLHLFENPQQISMRDGMVEVFELNIGTWLVHMITVCPFDSE